MIVKIKRQNSPSSKSYFQSFELAPCGKKTVSDILDILNGNSGLCDTEGETAQSICWECSCLEKKCGACAMVADGYPVLACSEFIDTDSKELLVLEPLSKFPVIKDLKVDRSRLFDDIKNAGAYIEKLPVHSEDSDFVFKDETSAQGESAPAEDGIQDESSKAQADEVLQDNGRTPKETAVSHELQYELAKCLKCGLCLEICPNYKPGLRIFAGAVLANESCLDYSLSNDRKKEIKEGYGKAFASYCSKSLACRDVCPVHMPTLSSIAIMNKIK